MAPPMQKLDWLKNVNQMLVLLGGDDGWVRLEVKVHRDTVKIISEIITIECMLG